jgi:hypothetical protein
MIHLGFNIFVFFLMLVLGWILFFAWLVSLIFRGIWRGFSSLTGNNPRTLSSDAKRCPGFRCGAENPPAANFCRRCGASLSISTAGPARSSANPAASRRWVSSTISS